MHISVNISMTADGKINLPRRRSLHRIGNEADKIRLKRLRQNADAILVGANTIRYDNAALRVPIENRWESAGLIYPLRIAVVGENPVSSDSKIFDPELGGTTLTACGSERETDFARTMPHIKTLTCGEGFRVDIEMLVERLEKDFGVKKMLIEGGAAVNGAFLDADLIDRFHITVCPFLFGGEGINIQTPIGGAGVMDKNDRRCVLIEVDKSDDWVFLTYDRCRM